jgi:AsmA protein
LGDGLLQALPPDHPATTPFRIDLTATREWHGPQTWTETAIHPNQTSTALPPRVH